MLYFTACANVNLSSCSYQQGTENWCQTIVPANTKFYKSHWPSFCVCKAKEDICKTDILSAKGRPGKGATSFAGWQLEIYILLVYALHQIVVESLRYITTLKISLMMQVRFCYSCNGCFSSSTGVITWSLFLACRVAVKLFDIWLIIKNESCHRQSSS